MTLIDQRGTAPVTEIAWQRGSWLAIAFSVLGGFVPGIAMGPQQVAGEVGAPSYRMLAQVHGRVQYFGFPNTLVLAVALHFLPRLRGVPVM